MSEDLMRTIICSDESNPYYGVTSGTECIRLLSPLFGKYFNKIVNHLGGPSIPENNTMYVYCNMSLNYKIEKTAIITKPIEGRTYGAFFDMLSIYPTNDRSIMRATAIKFNERYVGYYIKDRNILITCDMSHSEEDIELTKYIYDDLVSLLELKPIIQQRLTKKYPKTRLRSITVGCDPEFEFTQNGEVKHAPEYCRSTDKNGEIGLDGSGDQIELRPTPGTPIDVVNHIHKLINKFCADYEGGRLAISGHVYPLGAHIHVGIKNKLIDYYGIAILMDSFIGERVLDLSGKARTCYKQLTAYREQVHGFEYRTPPSAAFYNKKLTKILLKLARHLTYIYIKNMGKSLSFHQIPTKREYIKIGGISAREYDYFIKILAELTFKMKDKILYAQWGLNSITPKQGIKTEPIIEISFSDGWDRLIEHTVNNNFLSYLKDKETSMNSLIGKYDTKKIVVRFFGFKEPRNTVTNIPGLFFLEKIDGENTSKVIAIRDGILYITVGLPYLFRMNLYFYEFNFNDIISHLESHVQETLL